MLQGAKPARQSGDPWTALSTREGADGSRSSRAVPAVPDAAQRPNPLCMLLPELGPQPANVHVDGPRAAVVVVAPHVAEQRVAREHAVWVRDEELQEFVLHVGEVDR